MAVQLSEFKPDMESGTPLYLQLANKLSDGIHSGVWQPEEALPSERVLSDQLDISRDTARKAIDILCERGLLTRKPGSGTYIPPKLVQPLSRLTNFSDELKQRGFNPGSQWLSRETGIATAEEVLTLGLSPNAVVARLKRLRTADNIVMIIENSVLPAQFVPDPRVVGESLYGHLDMRNARPVRALQHIRAVNATAEQSRLANIKQDAAMLHIVRIGYMENGTPVELTHSYCRSDYYDFVAELRR
ncbi:MAG TPA: GntR family transcriptional regulator [Burkholderiaceae bacterium]|jgi:GntR family transcriptional regulator